MMISDDDGAAWREHALSLAAGAHEEYLEDESGPAPITGPALASIACSLAAIMCDLHEIVERLRTRDGVA